MTWSLFGHLAPAALVGTCSVLFLESGSDELEAGLDLFDTPNYRRVESRKSKGEKSDGINKGFRRTARVMKSYIVK